MNYKKIILFFVFNCTAFLGVFLGVLYLNNLFDTVIPYLITAFKFSLLTNILLWIGGKIDKKIKSK